MAGRSGKKGTSGRTADYDEQRDDANGPAPVELQARIDALSRERDSLLALVQESETNRRRIEQARREWTQALDAIDHPIFAHDAECRITRVNRAYAEQAGRDVHELVGRLYYECFPQLDRPMDGCLPARESEEPQRVRVALDDGRVFVSRSYPLADSTADDMQSLHIMEDITEQERAEGKARSLGRAVEQAAEGIVLLDAHLNITYTNPAMTELTGHAAEEMIGRHIDELRPSDAEPKPHDVRDAIVSSGRWTGEVVLRAADGSLIPVNLSAAGLVDEHGEPVGFVNTFLDLRPIKAALEQVETLYQSIEDVSLQLDVDTVAQKVLMAVTRVCGADAAAVAVVEPDSGRLYYRWHHGAPSDARVEDLRRDFDADEGLAGAVLRSGTTQIIEEYPNFPGALASFVQAGVTSVMGVPFGERTPGASGILSVASLGRGHRFQPAQVRFAEALARQLGVALQREQLLDDVRASSQRLMQVVATVPDVLFVLDIPDFDIALVSPAVTELLGYTPEELIADPAKWRELIHSDDRDRVFHELNNAADVGDGLTLELRMWHRDGRTLRWFEGRGVVGRDGRGQAKSVIGALTDITVRRQSEEQLRRVNRALTTLSRGNEALVRAEDEDTLFASVCTNVTEAGGYALAWVGMVTDDDERTVSPAAWAGRASSYVDGLQVSWAEDSKWGRGPIGMAIRSGSPVIVRDVNVDPNAQPWRARARQHGLASSISIPLSLDGTVVGALNIYAADTDAFDDSEQRLLTELASDLAYGLASLRTRAERERVEDLYRDSLVDTIRAVARTVEKRDPYTAGHQQRVAEFAAVLALELGMTNERIQGLRLGALIHDIGKIYIPAEILNRPGRLTTAEFEIIKTHPEVGYDIVKDVHFPWPVAEMILQHHERLNGSGYPRGLKGKEIILEARIMAVADVVEAITSHRPYRPGHGLDKALEEIRTNRGVLYDADVTDACLRLFEDKGFSLEALDALHNQSPTGGQI